MALRLDDAGLLGALVGTLTLDDADGYRPEYARQAGKLARAGFGREAVADFLEVSAATLTAWCERRPDLPRALEVGEALADADVGAALYRAAIGHERTETRVLGGRTVTRTVHVPADVRACMYWLERRCPEEWSLRPTVRTDGGRARVRLPPG